MRRKQAASEKPPVLTAKAEAILEGAMREFLAHGYAATSMDRVAAAAAVSKATVYSHFKNKKGLFDALVRQLVERRFRPILHAALDHGAVPDEPAIALRRLATNMLDSVSTDKKLQAFMRLIIGESGRFPELADAYVNYLVKPVIQALTRYFKSQPQLKLPHAEAAARIFLGTLVYYVLLQEVLRGKQILPMKREQLVDSLLSLLLSNEPASGRRK
jgi:TetR/AcrR family transcriptional regulator, regulator of autoinduction and epiphytic fitness